MEKKEQETKKKLPWLMIFILLILIILIFYLWLSGLLSTNNFLIVLFLVLLLSIPVFIKIKEFKEKSKKVESIPTSSDHSEFQDALSRNPTIEPSPLTEPSINASNAKPSKPNHSAKIMTLIPIFVIAFVFIYVFIGNPLDFIVSNPVGKWYYEMEVDGTNLTEYWYMILDEDGTLVIGIKNQGFAEDPEGSGTWSVENGVLSIEIDYDSSMIQDENLQLKQRGNKLYDLYGNETGYVKK